MWIIAGLPDERLLPKPQEHKPHFLLTVTGGREISRSLTLSGPMMRSASKTQVVTKIESTSYLQSQHATEKVFA